MPDGVEIWFVDLDVCGAALLDAERAVPRLAADEVRRFEVLAASNRAGAGRWRAAHIALRILIERCLGESARQIPYSIAPGGRPELEPCDLSFSLSHSAGAALIGLTRAKTIGVDLEAARGITVTAARREKIEQRAERLGGSLPTGFSADQRFLQAWTRLEAHAKAEGRGVLRMLADGGLRKSDADLDNAPKYPCYDLTMPAAEFVGCAAAPGLGRAPVLHALPGSGDALAAIWQSRLAIPR